MTDFIPPYLGDEIKSNAERKVFDILQNLNISNAVVLHSLGLPRHNSKIYGEIDFVVICKYGIACLEIKGGAISCNNGLWSFTDRFGNVNTKPEGPFDQVTEAMFSLRKRIWSHFSNNYKMKNINFASGVIFPDIEFKYTGQSIITEIIFDLKYTENDITDYVKGIFSYWLERNPRVNEKNNILLSKAEIDNVKNFLRGDFGFVPSLNEYINTIESRLLKLTEEQYNILDALSENDRLMIEGSAGTGKTLLAVEYAKRQSMSGKRTLLIVYNKNLSISLKQHENGMLRIEHFHGLISHYIPITSATTDYFEKELPELFFERLCSGDIAKYDVIIIDEAQDLLKPTFLMCIDELLKDGMKNGKWCLFYDRNQNLYNNEINEGLTYLEVYNVGKWTLQYNCRNTKPIGLTNSLITHFPPAKVIKEDGENVEYITYINQKEFAEKLGVLIKKFKLNSFNLNDILLLSPCTYLNSIISQCKALAHICNISMLNEKRENAVVFSTIQGFKGLESKVVILTDIDKINKSHFRETLYTAISRAKVSLYIICTLETKKMLDKRYVDGVKKQYVK
jgi:DNA replication protein DnaC